MMKRILKARTQMVESMYKYFDSDLSESHRAKLYHDLHATRPKVQALQLVANTQVRAECPCYAQCVYSFVRLYDRG